jgi:hypothetical protein
MKNLNEYKRTRRDGFVNISNDDEAILLTIGRNCFAKMGNSIELDLEETKELGLMLLEVYFRMEDKS